MTLGPGNIDSYTPWLQKGLMLRDAKSHEQAISAFQNAIAARPLAAQPFFEIARCLADLGKNEKALEYLSQGQRLSPNESRPHSIRTWVYCNMGKARAAEQEANLALEKWPGDTFAMNSLGRAYSILKDWPKTKTTAERVLAIDPENTYALNLLATALFEIKQFKASQSIVANVLRLDPESVWGHANAGYLALVQRDQPRAEGHFRESLRINPRYGYARVGLLLSLQARYFLCRWGLYLRYVKPTLPRSNYPVFLIVVTFSLLWSGAANHDLPEWLRDLSLFGLVLLVGALCVVGIFFYFYNVSRHLMNLSFLWDPQVKDLLTSRAKTYAVMMVFLVAFFSLQFLLESPVLLILPALYLCSVAWAARPRTQGQFIDLTLPEDQSMESHGV